ncbi:MAG: Ppx/GppA family phosphatase [Actinomycetia bacterium]|nr:Ppx/GppA family phosphatase [Actinomycetes bacterium]
MVGSSTRTIHPTPVEARGKTDSVNDLHAAIDIGTNSIHLVVARATPGGGFDVVTTEKEMVRLGSGGGDMKRLQPDAIERGVVSIARMAEVAASLGADVTAVATSAVREAENRDEFVERVRRDHGIEVEVISGFEEARLIHRGVIHAVPVSDQRALIVDIGGGSTELIIGEGSELIEARSLRLGAIRLTQRFFGQAGDTNRVPSGRAIQRCRTFLRDLLEGPARELGGHQPQLAIGSSGTISAVATMIAAARGGDRRQTNGFSFQASELALAVDEVTTFSTADRHKIPGLDSRRADIVIGGILLLDEIFAAFGLESMTISDYALREGVLFDRFPTSDNHLLDLRRSNAMRLARQLDPDVAHAETTARLACQIFDRTVDMHGLGPEARQLLEVAAIVHNVGLFISHSGHHKHSYYIVRNSEQLTGFTEFEIELVALIVRYHRRSQPSDKHPEFAALDPAEQHLVRVLAGMLRLAIGLDRRQMGQVTAVTVRAESDTGAGTNEASQGEGLGSRLVVEPVVSDGGDVSVEIAAATSRSELLAGALGVAIIVRERPCSDRPGAI